eukprot:12909657-Alexandrium_andersonii.AAC.1
MGPGRDAEAAALADAAAGGRDAAHHARPPAARARRPRWRQSADPGPHRPPVDEARLRRESG